MGATHGTLQGVEFVESFAHGCAKLDGQRRRNKVLRISEEGSLSTCALEKIVMLAQELPSCCHAFWVCWLLLLSFICVHHAKLV